MPAPNKLKLQWLFSVHCAHRPLWVSHTAKKPQPVSAVHLAWQVWLSGLQTLSLVQLVLVRHATQRLLVVSQ
jgi:hypothetical protein